MADVAVRLDNFISYIGWKGTKIQCIEWINNHLKYLSDEVRLATNDFLLADKFEGEYFRANEGRAALYALYQREMELDTLREMELESDRYHLSGTKTHNLSQLTRAFYLAEYVAYHCPVNDVLSKCLKAATYGIDAKCWRDAYYVAVYPYQTGHVTSKELQVLVKIAEREMAHERDYGKLRTDY